MARRALAALTLAGACFVLGAFVSSGISAESTPGGRPTELVWTPATLVFNGHGWGHGVGMSQWGAYGYAQHGYTYRQIIEHYFPGTDIQAADSRTIRVLLARGKPRLTISSQTPFAVTDANGNSYSLANLSVTLGPALRLDPGDGSGKISLAPPVEFSAGASPLAYGGREYRGAFVVSVVGDKVRLVNRVGLESYLYGVVPCESPHDWPEEALEAQAVVSRTYALVSSRPNSDFDVYPDTRSQVYLGLSGEYPESTTAVKATAGEAVYYQGEIAHTYYFSTSGGQTAAVQDVWPNAKPEPYLVSVSDPYDAASPYHDWGPVTVSSRKLARALKIHGPVSDVTTSNNPSKRVATVTVTTASGATYALTGNEMKAALGLRSDWFRATVLALQHPQGPVAPGTRLRVSGVARRARSPELDTRAPGGIWEKIRDLSPGSSGAFKVTLRPKATAFYRVAGTNAVGPSVRFVVTG
jgi:stage II sporulation protein D